MSILAFAGASGVGKSTSMREFLRIVPGSALLTSYTSRPMRNDEIVWQGVPEYVQMGRDKMEELDDKGVFLQLFGREEYKTLYATKVEDFERALSSKNVYVCALFVPGIDLFFDEAAARGKERAMHAVFIDMTDEEERVRRLKADNNRDQIRFSPDELANWHKAVARARHRDRFLTLDSTGNSPQALVHQAINHFGFALAN